MSALNPSVPTGAMDAGITGPLVLVDISGYTTYVAETELTHSQILVAELLDAVLQSLGTHLEVSGWKAMPSSSLETRRDRS